VSVPDLVVADLASMIEPSVASPGERKVRRFGLS